jgi:ribosomal protein S18 acetylase RimI-like enzyme
MDIRPIEPDDEAALVRFFERIPESDRTFLKEDVGDPAVLGAWAVPGAARAIAVDSGEVVGSVAVVPLHGWSSHVGEVRVIVDPAARGRGIGRALARGAILSSLELGLTKLVVEVMADQEVTIAMFRALGFDPEALLEDQVRDSCGELHDLMILSHSVEEAWASIQATGIADGLAG